MIRTVACVALVALVACASGSGVQEAGELRARGEPEAAIDVLQRAVAAEPQSAASHLALGEALIEARRFDEAVPAVEKAQELEPSERALIALVAARFGQGKFEQAAQIMERVLESAPTADNTLRMGLIRLAQHRLAEATDLLQAAVRMDPKNSDAAGALGRALAAGGRYEEAATLLEGVIKQYKKQSTVVAEFRVALAQAYTALGRDEDAYRELRLAVSADARNVEAVAALGGALRRRKQVEQAIDHLKAAEAKHPKAAVVQYELGLAYRDFELREQAMQCLEKAIKLDPSLGVAYGPLIEMLEEGEAPPDRVYGVMQPAAAKLLEDFEVQLRFGKMALKRKRYPEALEALGRAVRLRPNDVSANFTLGLAQVGAGRLEEAQESYNALQAIDEAKAAELAERIGKASAVEKQAEPAKPDKDEKKKDKKDKKEKKGRSKKKRGH